MSDELYCYPPDFAVLKNLEDIRDPAQLDRFERNMVRDRTSQNIPTGDFDLSHLQAIHKHLFQDVYAWAGEIRKNEISKGGHQFQFRQYIGTGMNDVHSRLQSKDYLRQTTADQFADGASSIIGDINYVHPFRDGNGRTQLIYLRELASQADHKIDLSKLERSSWIEASIQAHNSNYEAMRDCIRNAIAPRSRDQRIEQQAEQALEKMHGRQQDEQKSEQDNGQKR